MADRLVAGGVKGIFNFAPRRLDLPSHIAYVSMDLSIELEQLSFLVAHQKASSNPNVQTPNPNESETPTFVKSQRPNPKSQ